MSKLWCQIILVLPIDTAQNAWYITKGVYQSQIMALYKGIYHWTDRRTKLYVKRTGSLSTSNQLQDIVHKSLLMYALLCSLNNKTRFKIVPVMSNTCLYTLGEYYGKESFLQNKSYFGGIVHYYVDANCEYYLYLLNLNEKSLLARYPNLVINDIYTVFSNLQDWLTSIWYTTQESGEHEHKQTYL